MTDDQLAKWVDVTRDCIRKGGIDGPTFQYILGQKDLARRLRQIFSDLAAGYRQSLPLIERPASATIQIGTFKEIADLHQALTDGGFRIGDWASDLMGRPEFTLVAEPTELKLYSATNAELGYPNGCTVAETFAAIEKVGGVKLLPDAMAYLRLQYPNQPLGEWLLGYMDPITGSDGGLRVFSVVHDGDGLWLCGSHGYPFYFWFGNSRWVFRRK